MSEINSFFPTAGSLVKGDKIIVTKSLELTGSNGPPMGAIGIVNSSVLYGDLVILSLEVEGEFAASVILSDTEVEIQTPF
jgi:hypothetical protein